MQIGGYESKSGLPPIGPGRLLAPVVAVMAVGLLPASELPPPSSATVNYEIQVQPLFEQRCYACHGPATAMNGLRLDRKADAFAGGHSGPAFVPGTQRPAV